VPTSISLKMRPSVHISPSWLVPLMTNCTRSMPPTLIYLARPQSP
jgi:hypothetical protein